MILKVYGWHVLRILIGIMIPGLLLSGGTNAATLTVCHEGCLYSDIQDAINVANSGDTILVESGTYNEHVNVTKKLILRGIGMPRVNAVGNGSAIMLFANGITLEGFKATGSDWMNSGILVNSNHNLIKNNIISNNSKGISLNCSSNNTIISNIVSSNNGNGISLSGSSYNSMSKNIVSNNSGNGISLYGSRYNSISKNNISNNNGFYLSRSSNNNTLTGNYVSNNKNGIILKNSRNNSIYNNYFVNVNNAYDRGKNTWNTSKKHGKNIIGGPYLGGNYWSDYTGNDTDGDGLGNTFLPYKSFSGIRKGGDYLPLSQNLE